MSDQAIIVICLILSGFFSGMEIAFISANRLHIEVLGKQGNVIGRILTKFVRKPSFFLGTTLVGNNVALVLYGIYMARLMEPTLIGILPDDTNTLLLISQTLISTIIVLVTAEFLPKSIFLLNPDRMLSALAIPMIAIYYLMYPVTFLVVGISKFFIESVFGYEYSEDKPVFGLTDLSNYIKQTISTEEEQTSEVDARILSNAIEFRSVKVRECMIPRTEITAVEVNDSIDELREAFIQTNHSKIIVYKESIDEIVGYCHSLEMFKKPKDIKDILTPIILVQETTPANELLIQFITERKSLAWVVDEYGGTSGIVSMEDVMEEIFGEIKDEHDDEDLVENQLDQNTFVFSARHEIDYLNEKYPFELPEGEYDTLGGLILVRNEDIPRTNQTILIPGFSFEIMSMDDNRINTVKLVVMSSSEALKSKV
ncbi:MAG: HlyC/CorC family transporter [Cytophagales bacterium]|nr:HlyC/CorC family transporter [Cytophagales bacterium]